MHNLLQSEPKAADIARLRFPFKSIPENETFWYDRTIPSGQGFYRAVTPRDDEAD